MSFDWGAWMAEKPVRRERLVGWFMAHLTTLEDTEEIVTALILAYHLLGHDGGRDLAEAIKRKKATA